MTTTTNIKNYTFPDSKPHYMILDGLRGVAALLVVLFHVFECFDWSPAPHGYLAVDFFFVLSGFVIGYAYDVRWKPAGETKRPRLTMGGFFLRRLIRLHPMVVAGAVLGAVCFLLQGSVRWDGTPVGIGWVMLAMLLGMFMLPLYPGAHADVRGNGELFPLNGPNWSLFFEYIGNVLYALLLRRHSRGWSMADGGLWTGMVRMLFPYSIGMLMAREFRPCKVRHTFWLCSLVIVAVGCLPLLWGEMSPLANGLYDALCVVFVFPLLVWTGASELTTDTTTTRVSTFLGNLSYPLYAVHYPLMYLFYAHIGFHGDLVPISKLADVWHVAIALPVACIVLGWLFFRYYDLPLRRLLSKTYIK